MNWLAKWHCGAGESSWKTNCQPLQGISSVPQLGNLTWILPAMNDQDSNRYATLGGRACSGSRFTDEPELCGLYVLSGHSRRGISGWCTSTFALPARNAHESRLALTTLRRDVLAGVTDLQRIRAVDLCTLPGPFPSSRATSSPHPELGMARLRPASRARFLPGLAAVPEAELVMSAISAQDQLHADWRVWTGPRLALDGKGKLYGCWRF